MIFSLNPFMVTYNSKSAVVGAIRKNLNELSTFQRYEVKDYIIDVSLLSGRYKRMAYIVVPENKELPEAYVQALRNAGKRQAEWVLSSFRFKDTVSMIAVMRMNRIMKKKAVKF